MAWAADTAHKNVDDEDDELGHGLAAAQWESGVYSRF